LGPHGSRRRVSGAAARLTWLARLLTMRVCRRRAGTRKSGRPHSYPGFVPKRDRTLTFSATIRRDVNQMQTITVITILALLAISGAVVSDQILTNQEQVVAARF
jgi:hypothetical protein